MIDYRNNSAKQIKLPNATILALASSIKMTGLISSILTAA